MRTAIERADLGVRLATIRLLTGATRRGLTWLARRSSETGRGYLEWAGVDVARLLASSPRTQ